VPQRSQYIGHLLNRKSSTFGYGCGVGNVSWRVAQIG